MKRLLTIIITILLGVLLHFVYEWSGRNPFMALIGAVNESTWEHLKLLFFPFLFMSIVEYFFYKPDFKKFFSSRCIGMLCGLMSIIVIFYTYTGIYKNIDVVNIALYILSVFISFFVSNKLYKKTESVLPPAFSIGIFIILTLMFFVFTFYPPDINLFKSP
ncbi:MAG: hypothetical protein K2M60_11990 [Lachnospiraceae bacterium]|nr:hypothetical protein [Lachnospiraceae bacterium]MDE6254543.1 hypothetical protein [Lachnospiraceae bacterium]